MTVLLLVPPVALAALVLAAEGAPSLDLLQAIRDGGVVVAVLVLVWAILTKRLVPGWAYAEIAEERDTWRNLAITGLSTAERAAEAAATIAHEPKR